MRILIHDYAGHPFQIQLSRELARLGHSVLHAFAGPLQTPRGDLSPNPDDPASLEIREVPMHPRYPEFKYSFLRRRQMEIAYGIEAAALIDDWKPDTVISANTPTEAQRAIVRKARQSGTRFVSWVQDIYSVAVNDLLRKKIPLLGGIAGSYYTHLDRAQLRQSHHVVAIADDFKSLIINKFHLPEKKISVIPNWAPLESLPLLEKQNPWSQCQGLHDKFSFLYSGTLGMKHNPDLLLQLALQYKDDHNVRVVVISEGIGANWLAEKRAELNLPNLVLLPYQPFDQMPQVLAAGDVLIGILEPDAGAFSVPSKVLTYLCAGRPLLLAVPPANLASRITTNSNAGLSVDPHDTPAFLQAANQLHHDPNLRQIKAKNARNYAESTFKIAEIAVNFEKILRT